MCSAWDWTVRMPMKRASAISLSERPATSRRSTSRSRRGQVGVVGGAARFGRRRRLATEGQELGGLVEGLVERQGLAGCPRGGKAGVPERGARAGGGAVEGGPFGQR